MEITFEIKKELAILSKTENDYRKELNIISWNNGKPQLDLRMWKILPDGDRRPLKGIGISLDEAKALLDALKQFADVDDLQSI